MARDASEDDRRLVRRRLYEHNVEKSGALVRKLETIIDLVLRNREGQVVRGIFCDTLLYCLYIDILWIDARYRGLGYGTKMVLKAELIAGENGCTFAHTENYSHQSPDFYGRLGYEVFGVIDDYPEGIKDYFLKKRV